MVRMTGELIAPCGMNCALCMSYLAYASEVPEKARKAPRCAGCRPRDKQCAFIKRQRREHKCPDCGDVVCVHNGRCRSCGAFKGPRLPLKPLPKQPVSRV
jgi:hypothetical protein